MFAWIEVFHVVDREVSACIFDLPAPVCLGVVLLLIHVDAARQFGLCLSNQRVSG